MACPCTAAAILIIGTTGTTPTVITTLILTGATGTGIIHQNRWRHSRKTSR
jgi:hypothetical protein